jgi:hypothetical protein
LATTHLAVHTRPHRSDKPDLGQRFRAEMDAQQAIYKNRTVTLVSRGR